MITYSKSHNNRLSTRTLKEEVYTDGITKKNEVKLIDINDYSFHMKNMRANNWDIDCDCNLLNDITDDYGFHEDTGAVK